jgi:hypothetical protein
MRIYIEKGKSQSRGMERVDLLAMIGTKCLLHYGFVVSQVFSGQDTFHRASFGSQRFGQRTLCGTSVRCEDLPGKKHC